MMIVKAATPAGPSTPPTVAARAHKGMKTTIVKIAVFRASRNSFWNARVIDIPHGHEINKIRYEDISS